MSNTKPRAATLSRRLILHTTPELARVIAEHAAERRQTFSHWGREAFIAALKAEGCEPPADALVLPSHMHHQGGAV
jgi:hypothetical protein